jgi:hypothetical protein
VREVTPAVHGLVPGGGGTTKRPHFVPACYLGAWADPAGQVVVRRRGAAKVFTPNIVNVAVDAGLYGRGATGQSREQLFGQLEQIWPALLEGLTARGGAVQGHDRRAVSLFAAIQLVRTREHVAQTEFLSSFAQFCSRRPVAREDIRAFLTERHLRFPPSDREVEGAWTIASFALDHEEPPGKDEVLARSLDLAVTQIGPRLERLRWSVEHCRKPLLFTSDRPVMCWRPRSPRDRHEGIGIDNAEEIRLPLTPYYLLVMRRLGFDEGVADVQPRRFERVNAGIASQCHEFIAAAPSRRRQIELLRVAAHRPVLRFNVGPGFQHLPDGRREPMGDVVHMWVPTHALQARSTRPRR